MQKISRRVLRFGRSPKGMLLLIFAGIAVLAAFPVGGMTVVSRVATAAVVAAASDMAITYARRRRLIFPDGAILTGIIVAFILRPQEALLTLSGVVLLAIIAKHLFRTRWSNVLNPAAAALVVAAIALHTGQSWWGALPDLGLPGIAVMVIAGGFIANRINKLPMILAFFGVYFTLFSIASMVRSPSVAEIFVTPDLQAALFFAFFMLDDPPTSPVRYEDQVVFGAIVATMSYVVFMRFGGVYFLPAGLLAGNVWESGRRLAMDRFGPALRATAFDRRKVGAAAAAGSLALLLPLSLALAANSGQSATDPAGASSQVAPTATAEVQARYPFLEDFADDVSGNYTQTGDASSSHLTLDGKANGDLAVGLHVELAQSSVVPTPDDETKETADDDEVAESQPVTTITLNSAQLLDPVSNDLLCDGRLTALNRGVMRLTCDGKASYAGVTMEISGRLDADNTGGFSGSLNGSMSRTS